MPWLKVNVQRGHRTWRAAACLSWPEGSSNTEKTDLQWWKLESCYLWGSLDFGVTKEPSRVLEISWFLFGWCFMGVPIHIFSCSCTFKICVFFTDIENWLVDTVGEGEGGMNWESSMEIYTLPCVKWIASGDLLCDSGSSTWCSVTT